MSPGNMHVHLNIYKEFIKRKYIEKVKRGQRLMTPMQMLVFTLGAQGYLPVKIVALELFGMCGLWVTRDYEKLCSYLEFYEIDPILAKYAKRFVKNATIMNSDSIEAVNSRRLLKEKYNFIVSDNPFKSPYGNNYFEHFDLFPAIADYVDAGILLISFIYNVEGAILSREHLQRREEFYGNVKPSVKEALDVYGKLIGRNRLIDYVFLPRDRFVSFLAIVVG